MISLFGAQYGFLLPSAFITAIAIGSALLFYTYLRKGKSKRVSVASTMFLKFLESIPKARQKFLPPWRFFLELLLLVLLAAAAAGFYIKTSGNRIAILVDNSASMQMVPAGSIDRRSLFDQAVEKAKFEVLNAGWNTKYNIFVTSPSLVSLTEGYKGLSAAEEAIDKIKKTYLRDNLQAAGEKLLQEKDFSKIIVYTDKSLSSEQSLIKELDWQNLKPREEKIKYPNLALGSIRIGKSIQTDGQSKIDVSIQSFGYKEPEAKLKLYSCSTFESCKNPRLISEKIFSTTASGSSSLSFDNLPSSDLAYYLELKGDSFSPDDNAWITSKNSKTNALLVSDFSSQKLRLNEIPTLEVSRISPAEYSEFQKGDKIKEYNSVIFHNYVPEVLPGLNIVFVNPPNNKFFGVADMHSDVKVSRWKKGHPILSYLNLVTLRFTKLIPLKVPNVFEPLINTPQGVAAFIGELDGKRMAAFGFEIFPYEGRGAPLMSVLTLNVFKWISEIASETGYQRIDYPLKSEEGIESITTVGGREVKEAILEAPSLIQISFRDKPSVVQAVRFYNPEESNTVEIAEVKLQETTEKNNSAKSIGETLSESLVWLVLILLGLDLLILVIPRKEKQRTPVVSFSNFLRLATICFLTLSLINPEIESKTYSSKAYVLMDISDSNNEAGMQEELGRVKALESAGISLNFMPFAGRAEASSLDASDVSDYRSTKLSHSRLNIGETNLQNAFESLQSGEVGSVVLLSDGYQTKGDIGPVLSELKQTGFRVFPFVPNLESSQKEKLEISNLYAPLIARQGKSVGINVSIENGTSKSQSGNLEVKHGSKTLLSKSVTIGSGKEEIFEADSDPSEEGIKEITAIFRPEDRNFAISSQTIYLSGEKGEKILLLSGTPEDERFLKPVLENHSYQLKTSIAGAMLGIVGDLKEYSTVILNNIPFNQLQKSVTENINSYVKNGGSFVMIGGNKSFGLGGYINTPIEEVLPVILMPPQKEEKRLNVAVRLLIDKSRSMAEGSKIDFAKEAAIEVVNNLKDDDYIGVMGFDVNPFVVLRLSRLNQIRSEAERRIGLLYPNKGTSLVASIDEARRDLIRASAGRKHMLILTDGEITDAPKHYYFEMIKQVRLLGITVSTVMLGNDGDESMLKEMSNLGGGAFYRTTDVRSLPKIFINDLKVASGERTLKEENEYQVRPGPAGLLSTTIDDYPMLRGYVQTKQKSGANLELVTFSQNKADPLLASWVYGKGKSIAFTSDANGRWSEKWIGWPRYQKFWSDLIESIRDADNQNAGQVRFDLKTYYENAVLNLDMSVYSEMERGAVEAELILPDGSKKEISLKSMAPGRYTYRLESPKAGKYEFKARFGSKQITPVAFDLSGELLGEIKGQGYNIPLLRNIADTTSGKVNPLPEDLKRQQYVTVTKKDFAQQFMLAALLLFLFEIFWREVAFPIFSRRFRRRRYAMTAFLSLF